MPSNYAHYRFARRMLPLLPARVQAHEALYLAGCHGPDPLYYFDPFHRENAARAVADRVHRTSGAELFSRLPDVAREDGGRAFLFGLLTHYCLDSGCHPFVNGLVRRGVCGHAALETEFDRFLMEKDGIRRPHRVDLSEHVELTDAECAVAAAFFPPITAEEYAASVAAMRRANGLLSGNSAIPRFLVEWYLKRKGGDIRDQMMTKGPDPRTAHLDGELLAHYDRAEARFPELLRQLTAHLEDGEPLGPGFIPDFE